MSELLWSGKGAYFLTVSVKANWDNSMGPKEPSGRGPDRLEPIHDLNRHSENGHICELFSVIVHFIHNSGKVNYLDGVSVGRG